MLRFLYTSSVRPTFLLKPKPAERVSSDFIFPLYGGSSGTRCERNPAFRPKKGETSCMRCERYRAFCGLLVISGGGNLLHALLAVGFTRKQAYISERVAIGRVRYRLTVVLSGKRNPLQALLAIASFLIYNTTRDRRVKRRPVFFKPTNQLQALQAVSDFLGPSSAFRGAQTVARFC